MRDEGSPHTYCPSGAHGFRLVENSATPPNRGTVESLNRVSKQGEGIPDSRGVKVPEKAVGRRSISHGGVHDRGGEQARMT